MFPKSNDIFNADDARRMARKRLPWMLFDYIDGAAADGRGEELNRQRIREIQMMPRILNNVEHRSVAGRVFDTPTKLPFGISPMGLCNLAGPRADITLARMAAANHVPCGVSTVASTPLEQMIEWAEGHAWFQLYLSGEPESGERLLDRAKASGYETVVLTVDVPEVGRRPRELRRGFTMPFKLGVPQFFDFACHPRWSLATLAAGKPQMANFGGKFGEFDRGSSRAQSDWNTLKRVRDKWKGRLVVKGVLNVEDALRLKDEGVDAIQVSSHGGRQLESAPPPIDMLPIIRKAVGAKYPLFFDTGLRSGEDIVKAYALGADFVFLGRALSYSIAAKGPKGLDQMVSVLVNETSSTLAQLGKTSIDQIDASVLV